MVGGFSSVNITLIELLEYLLEIQVTETFADLLFL